MSGSPYETDGKRTQATSRRFPNARCLTLLSLLSFGVCFAGGVRSARAEQAGAAHITRIIKDVKVLPGQAAARPAVLSDQVAPGTGVRTGADSRAELTFTDLTITRLGQNTVFSFNQAERAVNLGSGTVLVEVPPAGAPVHVNTLAFTAAVSGGTCLTQFNKTATSSFMILEGHGTIAPANHPNDVTEVPAGEMVTLTADGKISKAQKFEVGLTMKTSQLITDFGPLPNEALIFQVIDQGGPGSGPRGSDLNNLTDAVDQKAGATSGQSSGGGGSSPPVPGQIPVIPLPNPYVINSGTTITTDPTITTNGVTSQGIIYQGQAIDGPVSAFAYGATSAFDTASGFDLQVKADNQAAVFKFTALELTGDPMVDTTNGPIDLGLFAVNGISSGAPGGPITFSGLRGVLLATQNGSVTLGPEISFSGLHSLDIYARGGTSDLTLGSAINTMSHVDLFAERDMTTSSIITTSRFYAVAGGNMTINGTDTIQAPSIILNSFHDLAWDGETSDLTWDENTFNDTPSSSDGSVTITAAGNINVANDLSFTRHSAENTEGLNLTLSADQNATVGGNLTFVVDNSNGGSIGTGGNISINTGGNLTVNGSTGITSNVLNNQGGDIEDGGNISINVGGDLKAEGLSAFINTRDGGTIDHGVTLGVTVGGDLNFDFGSQMEISTRADQTTNGGVISGDALISVHAGSVSGASSDAIWTIENTDGGHIQGSATVSAVITGNAGFALGGLFDIENNSVNTLQGGLIDGNAVIDFSAANISSGDGELNFQIINQGNGDGAGGQIGGDASITIHAANLASAGTDRGDIGAQIKNKSASITGNAAINLTATGAVGSTFAGNVDFSIDNSNFGGIGGDASINAQMASLGSGNSLSFEIDNETGFIGGNANVGVTVTGADGVNLPNSATFAVNNTGFVGFIQPQEEFNLGIIGGASVNLDVSHGGFMDDDGLEANIHNDSNSIGGDASVTVNVANALQINAGDANVEIFTSNGFIGGDASVSASAGSVRANNVLAQIDNSGGTINGAATVALNVAGDVTAQSPNGVLLQILNEGGAIGSGAAGNGVSYTAGGATTATVLQLYVDNSNVGNIGNGGNLNLDTTGPVALNGPLGLEVDNYAGGNIGTGGNVTGHFHGDVSDTAGSMHSFNFLVINGGDPFFVGPLAGGTIGTGGNIDVTFDGDAKTTPTATTGGWTAEIENDGGSIGTGGNISLTVHGDVLGHTFPIYISNRNGGSITNGGNITVKIDGTIKTDLFATFEVYNNGGTIGSVPKIDVHAGSFDIGGALVADIDNETGTIDDGGNGSVTLKSDAGISVGAGMWVYGQVTAVGDIDAKTMGSTDVTTTGNINAGTGGIVPFRFVDGNNTTPDVENSLTAVKITSQGGINFNGQDSDGASFPGENGHAVSLNPGSISFGTDIVGNVTLNGGAGASTFGPGDGGRLAVSTGGTIDVSLDIEATTGYQDSSAAPAGAGGTVTLTSTGDTVTVNNRIEVSSDDPTPSQTPPPPIRRSNQAGAISIESGKASGTAIQVSNSAQLLALLDSAATGPGGTIIVEATGASSSVKVSGVVKADKGEILIDHTGDNGSITLSGTGASDSLTMHADTIKVGALGMNGVLTIGQGTLTADTLLALYAGGSNGNVVFNADVTLDGASTKYIVGKIVTINDGITVTIGGPAAQVFTDTPNYAALDANNNAEGGNGTTTGQFGGSGASTQPLASATPWNSLPHPNVVSHAQVAGSAQTSPHSHAPSGQPTLPQTLGPHPIASH